MALSNLEYYIITYKKNPTDEYPVCNIFDFYNTYMKGLNREWYREYSPKSKILCFDPNHQDAAPSMGSFKDKKTGTYLYHCFGCNAHGNVVDMYMQYMYLRSKQRIADRTEACKGLAALYNISLDSVAVESAMDNIAATEAVAKNNKIQNMLATYTANDYSRALLRARRLRRRDITDLDNITEDNLLYIAYLRGMFQDNYHKKEIVEE